MKTIVDLSHTKGIYFIHHLKRWKLVDISPNTIQGFDNVICINSITRHWKVVSSPSLMIDSIDIIPSIDRLSLQILQGNIECLLSFCLYAFLEKRLTLKAKLLLYIISNILTTIAWNRIRKDHFQCTRQAFLSIQYNDKVLI